jgi:hypothetical protein
VPKPPIIPGEEFIHANSVIFPLPTLTKLIVSEWTDERRELLWVDW